MKCFGDLIALWPRAADMALEVGVSHALVRKWSSGWCRVDQKYWQQILDCPRVKAAGVTADDLVRWASARGGESAAA